MPLKRLSLKRSRPKEKNVPLGLPTKKVRGARNEVELITGPFRDEDFFGNHDHSQLWGNKEFKVPSFLYSSDKSSETAKTSVPVKTGTYLRGSKLLSTRLVRNQVNSFSKKSILKSMNVDSWEILSYSSIQSMLFHGDDSPEMPLEERCEPSLLPQRRKAFENGGSLFPFDAGPLIGYRQGWKNLYDQEEMPVLHWKSVRDYCTEEQQLKGVCRSKAMSLFNNGINTEAATRRLHLTRPPLIIQ